MHVHPEGSQNDGGSNKTGKGAVRRLHRLRKIKQGIIDGDQITIRDASITGKGLNLRNLWIGLRFPDYSATTRGSCRFWLVHSPVGAR
jgi:hypothetical protein